MQGSGFPQCSRGHHEPHFCGEEAALAGGLGGEHLPHVVPRPPLQAALLASAPGPCHAKTQE